MHQTTASRRSSARVNPAARIDRASVCYFQAPEHELPGGESVREHRDRSASLRAFREVSGLYFRHEAAPHRRADIALFGFISAIAAWPIVTMMLELRRIPPPVGARSRRLGAFAPRA
jgi:hypothetical protein